MSLVEIAATCNVLGNHAQTIFVHENGGLRDALLRQGVDLPARVLVVGRDASVAY